MKRLLVPVMAILCLAMALVSCQQAPFITVTGPKSFSFTREGGSESFTFSCNRDWSVSTSDSWIQVTPSTGVAAEGDVSVKMTCSPNTTYDPRTATVTIKAEELTVTISISQDTGIGLIVSPKSFDVSNDAQYLEVELMTNVSVSIGIDPACKDWVSLTEMKSLSSKKVWLFVKANESYDPREGKVTFQQQDGSLSETITIRQSQNNGLFVFPNTFELDYKAQEIEVEAKYNVEYDVVIPASAEWISIVEGTKSLATRKTNFSIQANGSYDPREATISFLQKNGELADSVLIKQAGKIAVESVELNKTELVLVEDKSETLVATVKPDNAADKEVTWSSSNSAVATVDQNGKVTAIKEGSATIKAQAGEKQALCSVKVERDKTKATALSIKGEALFIHPKDSYKLHVSVTPEDAICDFNWEVVNAAVSVVGYGADAILTAQSAVTKPSTVTVTDRRTGLSASIKVYTYISDFAWNESSEETYNMGSPLITIPVGGTYQLKYTSGAGSNVLNIFGNQADMVYYELSSVLEVPTNITITPEGLVTGVKEGITGIKTTGYITSGGSRVYFRVANSLSESEFNDTEEYANNVPYGVSMNFSLMNTSDVDWFKLQTPSSSGYITATISVEYPDAVILPEKQVRLCKYSLYDSGMQLWGAGSFSFSNKELIATTTRTVPSGPLFLKVYFDTSRTAELLPLGSMKLSISVKNVQ